MRRLILLDKLSENADSMTFSAIMWIDVPAGRETYYANPNFQSALPADLAPNAAELDALQTGHVKEVFVNITLAKRDAKNTLYTPAQFQQNAKQFMTDLYVKHKAVIDNYNPKLFYGTTYSDESGWVVQTIP